MTQVSDKAQTSTSGRLDVAIRPLAEADLDAADHVMRVAFGTFLGAPDPERFFGEVDYVRSRFAADPTRAFAAVLGDELVGSSFATRWGSFGSFGPLTVRPDLWDRGIAGRLLEPTIELLDSWGVHLAGLFTFAQSAKHVALYQRFGFWPQYLTAVMAKAVATGDPTTDQRGRAGGERRAGAGAVARFSEVPAEERAAALRGCHELTDAIFAGLDATTEIQATDALALGDTVLLREEAEIVGFAVCHCGAGEAGTATCYVKFGAARPGPRAGERFVKLLDACEQLAAERGLVELIAGVNVARHDAYRRMLGLGYRTRMQGVVMQRPNELGYCRPDAYVIDDLR